MYVYVCVCWVGIPFSLVGLEIYTIYNFDNVGNKKVQFFLGVNKDYSTFSKFIKRDQFKLFESLKM